MLTESKELSKEASKGHPLIKNQCLFVFGNGSFEVNFPVLRLLKIKLPGFIKFRKINSHIPKKQIFISKTANTDFY